MNIFQARDHHQYNQARTLFREYADSLGIDLSYQDFNNELKALQEMYSPPGGILLMAGKKERIAGCVGVRALPSVGKDACEMKRLYIRPAYRGHGLGRGLTQEALAKAKALGYRRIYLDTLIRMEKAISLYQSLGFEKVEKYYDNPRNDTCYFRKEL